MPSSYPHFSVSLWRLKSASQQGKREVSHDLLVFEGVFSAAKTFDIKLVGVTSESKN
jgi:hypothetical protein